MTEREMYLAMAKWLRVHGFSPSFRTVEGCGCFLCAIDAVEIGCVTRNTLRDVIGGNFGESMLKANGWTEGCTDDAVAACLIAADLAA
jgi:hypothetical protein